MNVLFFDRNFRSKSIAIIDEKKEEIIPIIVGIISIADVVRKRESNSTKPDIEIAGIPTRNESLAAVFLSKPENNAEVKVTPDLETPGNIAKDCEIPNNIISLNSISLNNFLLLP